MLELKTYSKPELSEMLGTQSTQGLRRKLERYGVSFAVAGRGERTTYTIHSIADPLKIFLITELDFDANTDFRKVRNLYFYFFNDEEFMAMPDEVKEHRMREHGRDISRQTIANYIEKLRRKGWVYTATGRFIYYFAHKDQQRIVGKAEYLQAWHEYWDDRMNGHDSISAICSMIDVYGGVARKQEIPEANAIYKPEIEYMQQLIHNSLSQDVMDKF